MSDSAFPKLTHWKFIPSSDGLRINASFFDVCGYEHKFSFETEDCMYIITFIGEAYRESLLIKESIEESNA